MSLLTNCTFHYKNGKGVLVINKGGNYIVEKGYFVDERNARSTVIKSGMLFVCSILERTEIQFHSLTKHFLSSKFSMENKNVQPKTDLICNCAGLTTPSYNSFRLVIDFVIDYSVFLSCSFALLILSKEKRRLTSKMEGGGLRN